MNYFNQLVQVLNCINDHLKEYYTEIDVSGNYRIIVSVKNFSHDLSSPNRNNRNMQQKIYFVADQVRILLNEFKVNYPVVKASENTIVIEWNAFLQAGSSNSIINVHKNFIDKWGVLFNVLFDASVLLDRIVWFPLDTSRGNIYQFASKNICDHFLHETKRQGYDLALNTETINLHYRGTGEKYTFLFQGKQ